jgi:hypothetical protein
MPYAARLSAAAFAAGLVILIVLASVALLEMDRMDNANRWILRARCAGTERSHRTDVA